MKSRDLAIAAGITMGTLRNITCGNSQSHAARQRISDVMCATIWPGIEPKTTLVTLSPGAKISNLTLSPREILAQLPAGAAKIVNYNAVRITRSVDVIFEFPQLSPPRKKLTKKDKTT